MPLNALERPWTLLCCVKPGTKDTLSRKKLILGSSAGLLGRLGRWWGQRPGQSWTRWSSWTMTQCSCRCSPQRSHHLEPQLQFKAATLRSTALRLCLLQRLVCHMPCSAHMFLQQQHIYASIGQEYLR